MQADSALLGGETAEHPGLMPEEEYDLAGFSVGVVDRKDMITGENIRPGDTLVGIASTGVHSNGFSLVRKVFGIDNREVLEKYYDELGDTLGNTLLTPTRIYVHCLKAIREAGVTVRGCSHVTGGGFYENIPRMLPDGTVARIKKDSYPMLPIFPLLQKTGNIDEKIMYNTFNMGIGLCLAVAPEDAQKVIAAAAATGDKAYVIGEVVAADDAPNAVFGGNTKAESRKGVELC